MNMKKMMMIAAFGLAGAVAQATIVTQWDFSNGAFYNTNTNTPVTSTGSGSANIIGLNSPNADFTGTDGTNTWRLRGAGDVSGNGWDQNAPNKTQGAEFFTSTTGLSDVVVSFDWWTTNNAIKHGQFQYTDNGTDWNDFGDIFVAGNATDFTNGAETFATVTRDLSSVVSINNNANFGFRIVAAYSPVAFTDNAQTWGANEAYMVARFATDGDTRAFDGASGNWRFSDVTVTAIPEPSTIALVLLTGLAALCGVRRRRK
ncbi:MAG: PEP-CTERM sorting domain-containing protein [Verrucomicrobia bacterium]|nr:PEP-CTERM sorting domain-containing protein [Verrucomicrobiota bacterium]MCH8525780.1 PEP-CTERM sorting domain-containing protein [Kiritimatiellia bacterium]